MSQRAYADEWKSPWRIEQEQRRAEEAAKRKLSPIKRLVLCTPLPKRVRASGPRKPYQRVTPVPKCICGKGKRRDATFCQPCSLLAKNNPHQVCTEQGCTAILQRNNTLGKCLRHAAKLRSNRAYQARKLKGAL